MEGFAGRVDRLKCLASCRSLNYLVSGVWGLDAFSIAILTWVCPKMLGYGAARMDTCSMPDP